MLNKAQRWNISSGRTTKLETLLLLSLVVAAWCRIKDEHLAAVSDDGLQLKITSQLVIPIWGPSLNDCRAPQLQSSLSYGTKPKQDILSISLFPLFLMLMIGISNGPVWTEVWCKASPSCLHTVKRWKYAVDYSSLVSNVSLAMQSWVG